MKVVFSGLSSQVSEDVTEDGAVIVVRARTPGGPVACPGCGAATGRVHGYLERTLLDVPADGRLVRVRRMRCPVLVCPCRRSGSRFPG